MKILLATDGSDYSEEAAGFLTRFNFSQKDEIVVLHVISEIPYEDDYKAQIRQAIRKVAPKILESTVNILKPVNAKIKTVEADGYPDTTIIEKAVSLDIDLIVMGARGIKGVKIFFLGSSTRSVTINSPKPVLVIKRHQGEVTGKMKIIFATDGSDSADETARFLSLMPFPDDAGITVMHVSRSDVSDIPDRYIMEISDEIKEEVARIRTIESAESEKIIEKARTYLEKRFTKVYALQKTGDPSIQILNEANISNADLIAIGSRGLRGVKGMLGSVSRRILGHSECSVLIGKA